MADSDLQPPQVNGDFNTRCVKPDRDVVIPAVTKHTKALFETFSEPADIAAVKTSSRCGVAGVEVEYKPRAVEREDDAEGSVGLTKLAADDVASCGEVEACGSYERVRGVSAKCSCLVRGVAGSIGVGLVESGARGGKSGFAVGSAGSCTLSLVVLGLVDTLSSAEARLRSGCWAVVGFWS